MYKIKGQDQKEYGPVDAAQLRQWISQGRADAQTLVRLEGTAGWLPLGTFAEFAAVIGPPPLSHPAASPPPDNAIATIIPYRNVPALLAYYLGIFSLIPCFGLVLGVAAFILGIMGLKRARQSPEAKGKVHAWIGILLGGFCAMVNLAVILFYIGLIARNH